MKPLAGQIAVVTGATRGAGRGTACMLGEAGATVYCTGRSGGGTAATPGRAETIEETAEMVTARGGEGRPVRVDHTDEDQVAALFERVRREAGRVDILVNSIWGGDDLTEWGAPFWELSCPNAFVMLERALHSHIITNRHGAPLMIAAGRGLIVEMTDGDFLGYRGNLPYDLVKLSTIRLAYAMKLDLESRGSGGITAVAVTPGFLRSEAMLDRFGVSEDNWRDAVAADPDFAESETPCYVGRGIAALAADPNVGRFSGRVVSSWFLAEEYRFTDIDGRRPDWGAYFDRTVAEILDRGPKTDRERSAVEARYQQIQLDPRRARDAARMAAALGRRAQLDIVARRERD